MTHSKLKEQFARRGLTRDIDRVSSGSPVVLVLRPLPDLAVVNVIDATLALARRGLTMLRAKRAAEAAVEEGEALVNVPMVERLATLVGDLRAAGFVATKLASDPVDVRVIRDGLGLSQEQFALRFNLDLATLQNWEQGRYAPDRASANYLRVIARRPREAAMAQEEEAY